VAPLLAEGGSVLMSVPNVAHGDVRLHLLAGEWEYRPLGLLDETHLRFFTRQSLIAMIHDAGYAVAAMDRTTIPMFETEIGVVREHFPAAVVDHILADPDATTYQFIVRAVPMDGASRPAVLQEIVDDQTGQIDRLRRQLAGISADRERLIRH